MRHTFERLVLVRDAMAKHLLSSALRPRRSLQVALTVAAAVAMSLFASACSSSGGDGVPPASTTTAAPSASPATVRPINDSELFASLVRAIRSADPAMSPEALDAHIREVTKAPRSLIVAPYDSKAESESPAFMKTWAASHGIDGASAAGFSDLVYRSRGKPFHTALKDTLLGTLYVAGQPIEVGGLRGYVLVGIPAE